MRRCRRELLTDARGRTLEIGAGTGATIAFYPDAVEELILAEPYEPMRRRLEGRLGESDRSASTLDASAEALPLEDKSVDTVVSTLVLCTVDFQDRALSEWRGLAGWLETPWRISLQVCDREVRSQRRFSSETRRKGRGASM